MPLTLVSNNSSGEFLIQGFYWNTSGVTELYKYIFDGQPMVWFWLHFHSIENLLHSSDRFYLHLIVNLKKDGSPP